MDPAVVNTVSNLRLSFVRDILASILVLMPSFLQAAKKKIKEISSMAENDFTGCKNKDGEWNEWNLSVKLL